MDRPGIDIGAQDVVASALGIRQSFGQQDAQGIGFLARGAGRAPEPAAMPGGSTGQQFRKDMFPDCGQLAVIPHEISLSRGQEGTQQPAFGAGLFGIDQPGQIGLDIRQAQDPCALVQQADQRLTGNRMANESPGLGRWRADDTASAGAQACGAVMGMGYENLRSWAPRP